MSELDELLDEIAAFVAEYPQATLADVMAEFDLSDTEATDALKAICGTIESEARREVATILPGEHS